MESKNRQNEERKSMEVATNEENPESEVHGRDTRKQAGRR